MNPPSANEAARTRAIVSAFNTTFLTRWRTRLVGGGSEPLYRPATTGAIHTIVFREDYASSALHEIAHWCVAGAARRRKVDYGYWYRPGSERTDRDQARFLAAEELPQALECVFSRRCGQPFRVSLDNLGDAHADPEPFLRRVQDRARALMAGPMPPRAALFSAALGGAAPVPASPDPDPDPDIR